MKPTAILLRVVLIIILSFGLSSILSIGADNPSPVGWSLSGGGFCQGTYTVFNTSLTPNPGLYAENCQTGRNDCYNATDLGALMTSCVLAAMKTGGLVHLRQGEFSETTAINFGGSAAQSGSGYGITFEGSGAAFSTNGTLIEAKTNGMTMIESSASTASVTCSSTGCTGAPPVTDVTMRDFSLFANNLATTGIDFRMTEGGDYHNLFHNIHFLSQINVYGTGQVGWTGFTTCLYLDGNEDTWVSELSFYDSANTGTDIQWQVPAGNINIIDSFVGAGTGGSTVNLAAWAQTIVVRDSTINNVKILGTAVANSLTVGVLVFSGDYMFNPSGLSSTVNLNGKTLPTVEFAGDFISVASKNLVTGTGTINVIGFSGNTLETNNSGNWNLNGATVTSKSDGTNWITCNTLPTNWPFGGACNAVF